MARREPSPASDESILAVRAILDEYETANPGSKGSTYRFSPYSIRLRIVDPAFASMDLIERDEHVWKWLDRLSVEVLNELMIVILLTEREQRTSSANMDFDHPIPSTL